MIYIIEGTISEIKVEGKDCIFKICGSEGYSIKHGEKKYNVLYSEDIKEKNDKNAISSFVLIADRYYQANEKQECLLASALTAGKRIHVEIEATEDEIKSGMKELSVSSLTLLLD
ncbi:MAG: hypothetical protein IJ630_05820 [Treponema sp.]|nr:hypothetical protein [Treponema sp.]